MRREPHGLFQVKTDFFGSTTITAYLVIGAAMAVISTSCWPMDRTGSG